MIARVAGVDGPWGEAPLQTSGRMKRSVERKCVSRLSAHEPAGQTETAGRYGPTRREQPAGRDPRVWRRPVVTFRPPSRPLDCNSTFAPAGHSLTCLHAGSRRKFEEESDSRAQSNQTLAHSIPIRIQLDRKHRLHAVQYGQQSETKWNARHSFMSRPIGHSLLDRNETTGSNQRASKRSIGRGSKLKRFGDRRTDQKFAVERTVGECKTEANRPADREEEEADRRV